MIAPSHVMHLRSQTHAPSAPLSIDRQLATLLMPEHYVRKTVGRGSIRRKNVLTLQRDAIHALQLELLAQVSLRRLE